MAAHIWRITWAPWDLVAVAVHEPCVSIGPTSLIGFKSRPFTGHLNFLHVVCYKPYKCASSRVTWCVIPCQHHTEIGRRIWRRTDQMPSFRYLIAVVFPWIVTLGVFVCMKMFEPVLLYLLSPYLMFFILDIQRGILSY